MTAKISQMAVKIYKWPTKIRMTCISETVHLRLRRPHNYGYKNNFVFEKWQTYEIEEKKIEMAFENSNKVDEGDTFHFLGLGPKTPICAMQGDMGWTSPSCRQ